MRSNQEQLGMHTKTIQPTNLIEVGTPSHVRAVNPLTIISVRRDSRNDGRTSTQCDYQSGEQR